MADSEDRREFEATTADVQRAAAWHASLTSDDRAALDSFHGAARFHAEEKRTPFWLSLIHISDVYKRQDYQRVLEVLAVGLAGTAGVPVSDLAARVAATGARQDANFDAAGWAAFAILSLGMETLLPMLDGSCEGLTAADVQTLEDLRAFQTAMKRRDREERGWP